VGALVLQSHIPVVAEYVIVTVAESALALTPDEFIVAVITHGVAGEADISATYFPLVTALVGKAHDAADTSLENCSATGTFKPPNKLTASDN